MGLILGLLAAILWGIAAVAGALAARRIGSQQAVAWAMLISLVVAVPVAFLSGPPGEITLRVVVGTLAVSVGALSGFLLVYAALRLGSVSVVTPIAAIYGGVAALLSMLAGQSLSTVAIFALVAAVLGAVLAARGDGAASGLVGANPRRAALLAGAAALTWGVQLFAGGQIGQELGESWLVAFIRVAGVIVIGLPLLVRRRLAINRRVLPLLVVAGFGEVSGFTLFLYSARDGIAQASVLTSQYAAVAVVIGVVVLKERLQPVQVAGIVLIMAGVAVLAVSA